MTDTQETPIKYCLYARKSSESDERQAMSIDSQTKEMLELAKRNDIEIVETKQESHSAKDSGTRPLFLEMLREISADKYQGILTWAPDRLSRNAGDLGSLVDLMDRGKLVKIQTNSQSFSDNPAEKFLLMILCSQAKLENDNRGVNVKRGIRAKCEMGWRPAPAPIGYLNYSHAGIKKVMQDTETAPIVKEVFTLVANKEYSGRNLKVWLDDDIKFRTAKDNKMTLSMIYRMLKNTFYYGEFEYPEGSDSWYQGAHEPIISKMLFDKVQEKLMVPPKTKWGNKKFDFKGLFKCAYCGSTIIAEKKYRLLKNGSKRVHIYYHCIKPLGTDCPEPYMAEKDLINELLNYIRFLEKRNPNSIDLSTDVKKKMKKYVLIRDNVLILQNITPEKLKFSEYAKHVMFEGTIQEKQTAVKTLGFPLYIHNKSIITSPLQ